MLLMRSRLASRSSQAFRNPARLRPRTFGCRRGTKPALTQSRDAKLPQYCGGDILRLHIPNRVITLIQLY